MVKAQRPLLPTSIPMADFVLPESSWPANLPQPHRLLLRAVLHRLQGDPDIIGVAAGGSFVTGTMDEFSDLDLVVAVAPAAWPAILDRREALAADAGPLLAAFTGEHVHEPRLLITLYGPPLVHVDFKFVPVDALAQRVEDPIILWERGQVLTHELAQGKAVYPLPQFQWVEDRFWVWVHYGAAKAARGELLELLDTLAFLRKQVFGPLLLAETAFPPSGVRRLEAARPDRLPRLRATVARYDITDALRALEAAVALYRDLRTAAERPLQHRTEAEAAALAYLAQIRHRVGVAAP